MIELESYDDATLDRAFASLSDQVTADIAATKDVETFRLEWLGRKQGRLKLVSDAWLKLALS